MAERQDTSSLDKRAPIMLRAGAAITVVVASWWLMMAVHELGHIAAAHATGGSVDHVDLSLFRFSRTQLASNPEPLIVVWAGPVVGVALPMAVWALTRARWMPILLRRTAPTAAWFAGFCLIANGLYIGVGWIDRIGDAGDMQRHGTPAALMIAFGVACLAAGLWLWHTLGAWLGVQQLRQRDAACLAFTSLVVIALGLVAG